MTAPGAQLRFGQQALVPFRVYNRAWKVYTTGTLGIVVYSLQRVPGSKVQGNFDDADRALLNRNVAYYSRVVFTNEGAQPSLPAPAETYFDLYRAGKRPSGFSVLGGTLPGCVKPMPAHFEHKGSQWESCVMAVTSPSEPIVEIQYDYPPYGKEIKPAGDKSPHFNRYYGRGAISWH